MINYKDKIYDQYDICSDSFIFYTRNYFRKLREHFHPVDVKNHIPDNFYTVYSTNSLGDIIIKDITNEEFKK